VYEAAVRGYNWRVAASDVFLVHSSRHALAECPEVFGAELCSHAQTASEESATWRDDNSRRTFAEFIQSMGPMGPATQQEEQGLGMAPQMRPSSCLIYPSMQSMPVSFIEDRLDQAYMALAQVLEEVKANISVDLARPSPLAPVALLSNVSDSEMVHHWLAQGTGVESNWKTVSEAWCVHVPALVGQVIQGSTRLVAYVDSRVWEFFQHHAKAPAKFRHSLSVCWILALQITTSSETNLVCEKRRTREKRDIC